MRVNGICVKVCVSCINIRFEENERKMRLVCRVIKSGPYNNETLMVMNTNDYHFQRIKTELSFLMDA